MMFNDVYVLFNEVFVLFPILFCLMMHVVLYIVLLNDACCIIFVYCFV